MKPISINGEQWSFVGKTLAVHIAATIYEFSNGTRRVQFQIEDHLLVSGFPRKAIVEKLQAMVEAEHEQKS